MSGENAFICGFATFVISFCAYVITVGVGWSLNQDVLPDKSLIMGAAIVTTIPVFAVMATCLLALWVGGENRAVGACARCSLLIILLAGVFEIVGGILFIVAGATLKDENSNMVYLQEFLG